MLRKLLTNSLLFGISPYIPQVINVFLLPIMTQYLTATDYGIAGTINAYTQALTALSTLGFNSVLGVIFYKCSFQYKILWREIYGFLNIWMIFFAFLQGLLLYFIIPEEAAEYKWLIIALTNFSNVFFGPTATIGNYYYVNSMKPIPIVWRSILSGIVTLLANYILVVHYRLGYLGWYVGGFLGVFLMNASYWYAVNVELKLSPIYNFKRKTILKYLRVSLPTVPHYYCGFLLNSSSKVIMDFYSTPLPVFGRANIMIQISSLMENWVNAINQAIYPMCMESIKKRDEVRAKALIYVYLGITYFCTFIFSLWSREVFNILIPNKELASTYPYAVIFVMAFNYRPMYVGASNIFFYHEKTTSLLRLTFCSGIIAFVLYCILIPFLSIWGIVIAYFIASFYMGYAGFYMKVFKDNSKITYPILKIAAIHLFLTAMALFFVDSDLNIKIVITIVFIACLVIKSWLQFKKT